MRKKISLSKVSFRKSLLLTFVLLVALTACDQNPSNSPALSRPQPVEGTYFGVNLDWSDLTPTEYNQALGHNAAVFVQFFQFPLAGSDFTHLDATVKSAKAENGMVMITLEPWGGLETVTPEAVDALAIKLAEYNAEGTALFVRFAHEMNGSWYPWSQQPTEYIEAFRMIAEAVHRDAPGTAMVWAPNTAAAIPSAADLMRSSRITAIFPFWIPMGTANWT